MVPAAAEKLTALVPARIDTAAGPVSDAEFIMEITTGRPAAGATPLAVIVQVLAAPELRAIGAQASEVSVTGGVTPSTVVFDTPFNAAVMTADWVLDTAATEALKTPEVAEAPTVNEAGTVKLALLLVSAITNPPVGAAALSVIEQTLVPGPVNVAGLHVRPLTVTLALRLRVELTAKPFAAAVIVAAPLVEIIPAVAEKLALLLPAGTMTDAGVVIKALLSEILTAVPPEGATLLKVTVQLLTLRDVRAEELQANPIGTLGTASPRENLVEELL